MATTGGTTMARSGSKTAAGGASSESWAITFGAAFAVAPNVVAAAGGGGAGTFAKVDSVTNSGFTLILHDASANIIAGTKAYWIAVNWAS
jgi:hypothetical protein